MHLKFNYHEHVSCGCILGLCAAPFPDWCERGEILNRENNGERVEMMGNGESPFIRLR